MYHKRVLAATVRSIDETKHTIDFYASTSWHAPDDIVVAPEAWRQDMEIFMLNPVVTLFHNYRDFSAGRVIWWDIDEKGLIVRIEFAVEDNEQAAKAFNLYKKGFQNAVSVGFYILAKEDRDGFIYVTRARLIEVALVPVPMDAFALAIRNREFFGGLYRALDAGETVSEFMPGLQTGMVQAGAAAPRLRTTMAQIRDHGLGGLDEAMMESVAGALNEMALDVFAFGSYESLVRTVVPFKTMPLAPEDLPWSFDAADGNAVIEKGGWALFKECHSFVVGSGTPETKGAYKLPHHKIHGGTCKTYWSGVRAAMQRLSAADIPAADKERIFSHLARHYKEFGKEPPERSAYGLPPETPPESKQSPRGVEINPEHLRALEELAGAVHLTDDEVLRALDEDWDL